MNNYKDKWSVKDNRQIKTIGLTLFICYLPIIRIFNLNFVDIGDIFFFIGIFGYIVFTTIYAWVVYNTFKVMKLKKFKVDTIATISLLSTLLIIIYCAFQIKKVLNV